MKFTNNILQFSNNDTKAFERFRDYMHHYRAEVEGVKNLSYATQDSNGEIISFAEKEKKMNEALLKEVERFAGRTKPEGMSFEAWASDPSIAHCTFAVVGAMIDAILPETLIDSIGVYADIRFAGYGDSFAFDIEPRDLFSVSKSGNGKRRAFIQKQFDTTATLLPENHQVTVGVSVYKVLAGKESLAKFTMKAVRSIETQLTYDAYDSMAAGLNAITAGAGNLHLSSYTQDTAIHLAQQVTAWNNGRKAVFVGTQLALGKILPTDANYRYMLDSEYVKIGYVRNFNGFDCLMLPQVADYTSVNFGTKLADNRIYVISPSADKLIKVGVEGNTLTYVDKFDGNANLLQTATINKKWATGLITSAVAGVIDLA